MKEHLAGIFKSQSNFHPWQRMIACGLATGTPLLIGILTGYPSLAVYGALTGYLLALNDHCGIFRHRLIVITATFVLLLANFALGYLLQPNELPFQLAVAGAVYWLGLLGGRGAELERAVLFATLGLVIAFAAPAIPPDVQLLLGVFSGTGFVSLLTAIAVLYLINRSPPEPNTNFRESARKALTLDFDKHAHALSYALSALASIWLGKLFNIERAYWITITVLLIMRPDRTQSLYLTAQRLIGTLLAVILVNPALALIHHVPVFAILASLSGAAVPWGARRNYVWVSFFATFMVLCLLEIASPSHSDTHLPIVRLQATFLGCALSLLGTSLSKILDLARERRLGSL